jgi:hemerythrin superfamily protein
MDNIKQKIDYICRDSVCQDCRYFSFKGNCGVLEELSKQNTDTPKDTTIELQGKIIETLKEELSKNKNTEMSWHCRCGNYNKRETDYQCHSCGMKNKYQKQ